MNKMIMKITKKTVEKQGNTFRITPKNTLKTRAYSGNAKESVNVVTYSGSITSKGQIVDKSYSCSFDYEVRWSCVGDREHESVTGSVNSIDAPSGWYIYKTGFSYLAGDKTLEYTFIFKATTSSGYTVKNLSYKSSVSMAGKE